MVFFFRCIEYYLKGDLGLTSDGTNVVVVLTHALNITHNKRKFGEESRKKMVAVQVASLFNALHILFQTNVTVLCPGDGVCQNWLEGSSCCSGEQAPSRVQTRRLDHFARWNTAAKVK